MTKTRILVVASSLACILAALGFLAGGPDPTGTGYVYTVNGVTQGAALAGGVCQVAGYCGDAGTPCAYTIPSCDAGGGG